MDETNFNQNEFIINIHIDNKNEGGDKEFGTLLHFVKELNKNKIIPNVFEFANDVKKKSYIDVATYKEFSVHIVNCDNLSKPLKSKIKVWMT